MFDELYRDRRVLEEHRRGPLAAERERYLRSCKHDGYSKATLQKRANQLLIIANRMATAAAGVTRDQIVTAAMSGNRVKRYRGRSPGKRLAPSMFIAVATKWFRFLGYLNEPTSPWSSMIDDYSTWLTAERALSPATIRQHVQYVDDFLSWCHANARSLSEILPSDIDEFLRERCATGWARLSAACAAKVLRGFFRHALRRGWCHAPIAEAIERPRIYRLESLPAGPDWQDVIRLISHLDTTGRCDIRDRAVVMLCAVYGFRSSEIAQLKIEDFDWDGCRISVWRSKQRRRQEYPLVSTVAEAVIRYLRTARPDSDNREVFLTMTPPFRPLSAAVIYFAVSKQFEALGIKSRQRGPHSLRHACAAHLVDQGFSFKEVGDHLGHRCASATQTYAKVDLRSLRAVAAIVEGGVL